MTNKIIKRVAGNRLAYRNWFAFLYADEIPEKRKLRPISF